MKFSFALWLILLELGIGVLVCLRFVPFQELRRSFLWFQSAVAGVSFLMAGIAIHFARGSPGLDLTFLIASAFCFASIATARRNRFRDTRALHALAIVAAMFAGSFVCVAFVDQQIGWQLKTPPRPVYCYFFLSSFLGAMLLGMTHNAMALGHWYLISRNLSFEYLIRITKGLLALLCVRTFVFGMAMVFFPHLSPPDTAEYFERLVSIHGNLIFLLMRITWGLLLPFALAFMSWRCAVGKANQAATGLMYLCEVSVLFGELFAAYLMI